MSRAATVVLSAWIVSRVVSLVLLTVVGARDAPGPDSSRLLLWDGGWYRHIMLHGYGPRPAQWPPGIGGWAVYPFFPLYPEASRVLNWLGLPVTAALTLLPTLATLAALFGIYRLTLRHDNERTAEIAVWVAAVLPGTLTFAMAYPDALFLAGSTWAVVWAGERRYALAGLAAAFTTASRPNGAIVVVTLVLLLLSTPRVAGERRSTALAWYTVSSAAFLALWMWFMHRETGDALAFVTAKKAWDETNLWEAIRDDTNQTTWQLALGLAAIAIVVTRVRRQPLAWTFHALACILPALVVGVVGLIRYAAQAFPVPIGIASLLQGRRAATTVCVFGACALLLTIYGYLITHNSYVP